jgi:hypothetical protein
MKGVTVTFVPKSTAAFRRAKDEMLNAKVIEKRAIDQCLLSTDQYCKRSF